MSFFYFLTFCDLSGFLQFLLYCSQLWWLFPHAALSSFFSFLPNYWHEVSHLQLPHLWDSVLMSPTFPSLPSAALLDLHQSLLSLHLNIAPNHWFPTSILPTCFLVLIYSMTGSLLASFSPFWQYLQCCVNLHFRPTASALEIKTKSITSRSSWRYYVQSLIFSLLGYIFRNNSVNPSSTSSRRLRAAY